MWGSLHGLPSTRFRFWWRWWLPHRRVQRDSPKLPVAWRSLSPSRFSWFDMPSQVVIRWCEKLKELDLGWAVSYFSLVWKVTSNLFFLSLHGCRFPETWGSGMSWVLTWFVNFSAIERTSNEIKLRKISRNRMTLIKYCVCLYLLPEKCKKPLRTPEGEWIFQILKKAFAEPPKFSTLERYLHHQQVLLALGVDNEGNAERSVRDDCFSGNPNPRHHFSLKGKVPHI